jgi:hypothetical protein
MFTSLILTSMSLENEERTKINQIMML